MVDAMGGPNSKHYQQFKNLAGQGFNILRRHANLILALLKLMSQVRVDVCCLDSLWCVEQLHCALVLVLAGGSGRLLRRRLLCRAR